MYKYIQFYFFDMIMFFIQIDFDEMNNEVKVVDECVKKVVVDVVCFIDEFRVEQEYSQQIEKFCKGLEG